MPFGIDLRATHTVEALRQWVPLMKSKTKRHKFDTRDQAETAIASMKAGNVSLELRIVPLPEETPAYGVPANRRRVAPESSETDQRRGEH